MDLSSEKMIVVAMIALMVMGPERLPHAARTAGRMLAELRRLSTSVQREVTNAIAEPQGALNPSATDLGLEVTPGTPGPGVPVVAAPGTPGRGVPFMAATNGAAPHELPNELSLN